MLQQDRARRLRARHRRGPHRCASSSSAPSPRSAASIDWQGKGVDEKGIDRRTGKLLVEIDPRYFRPTEVDHLLGDAAKAQREARLAPHAPASPSWSPRWCAADLDRSVASTATASSRQRPSSACRDARAFDLAGKRVFVAGHRGMVGSALVRRLARERLRDADAPAAPSSTCATRPRSSAGCATQRPRRGVPRRRQGRRHPRQRHAARPSSSTTT